MKNKDKDKLKKLLYRVAGVVGISAEEIKECYRFIRILEQEVKEEEEVNFENGSSISFGQVSEEDRLHGTSKNKFIPDFCSCEKARLAIGFDANGKSYSYCNSCKKYIESKSDFCTCSEKRYFMDVPDFCVKCEKPIKPLNPTPTEKIEELEYRPLTEYQNGWYSVVNVINELINDYNSRLINKGK